ncbi:hypothetical protein Droror1_Dr00021560 [Drosera rotundifolia]
MESRERLPTENVKEAMEECVRDDQWSQSAWMSAIHPKGRKRVSQRGNSLLNYFPNGSTDDEWCLIVFVSRALVVGIPLLKRGVGELGVGSVQAKS